MDYPSQLRVSRVRDSSTDFFIGDPHAHDGLVARVYNKPDAAMLLAAAPDLKAALEAIFRVEVGGQGDFATCAEALAEVRSIAADALSPLHNPADSNELL